ncbi:MAG: substrate-binding domain-containing protein [Betaproteobacteria bacterium]|nr:substrate-binding domain-containing protein [Betaproteobacteria bacterium]
MKTCRARIASAFAGLILFAAAGAVGAAELKVFSTTALTEIWHELKPRFEASGHKLHLELQPSGAIGKRIAGGEAGDAIVSTAAGVEALVRNGKIAAGTTRVLASSGMGVAVLKGSPKPDISTPEAFKKALLAAKSVAYSDPAGGGASGAVFVKILRDLNIADEINARARLGRGIPNAEFVIKGESDIAIQQIPELMTIAGVDIVGPFPPALQSVTGFAAAALSGSANPEAARALVEFLASPETLALLKSRGFDVKP